MDVLLFQNVYDSVRALLFGFLCFFGYGYGYVPRLYAESCLLLV